jgi:uncharacterized membrane protein
VTPETQAISDSKSDNGSDEQEENVHIRLGGLSTKFVQQNIGLFLISQETFWDVYGLQFDTPELDVMTAFKNIFHIALVQLIVDETNRYTQPEILKSVNPFTFHSRIRKWKTVDEMYMFLALFMMMGIVQKPTLSSYYPQNWLILALFFPPETLSWKV